MCKQSASIHQTLSPRVGLTPEKKLGAGGGAAHSLRSGVVDVG